MSFSLKTGPPNAHFRCDARGYTPQHNHCVIPGIGDGYIGAAVTIEIGDHHVRKAV